MSPVVVIGYGNTLRGDDGLGIHVAERLRTRYAETHVTVISAQQLMPEMAETICCAELVIFVDAEMGDMPGEVRCRSVEAEGPLSASIFAHHLRPEQLLAVAVQLYGRQPRAALVTITGLSFEVGEGFSACVQNAIPRLMYQIEQLIASGAPC